MAPKTGGNASNSQSEEVAEMVKSTAFWRAFVKYCHETDHQPSCTVLSRVFGIGVSTAFDKLKRAREAEGIPAPPSAKTGPKKRKGKDMDADNDEDSNPGTPVKASKKRKTTRKSTKNDGA